MLEGQCQGGEALVVGYEALDVGFEYRARYEERNGRANYSCRGGYEPATSRQLVFEE